LHHHGHPNQCSAGSVLHHLHGGNAAAGNYDFTTFVPGQLTVNKAHLSVTADNQSRFPSAVFALAAMALVSYSHPPFVPFPPRRSERRVGGEQTSGEGCSNGRPMTLTESGRFRFLRRIRTPACRFPANVQHIHCPRLTPSARSASVLVSVSSSPTRSPSTPVPVP